ncbi:hypothetical protein [Rhabdothermincola salaria]|uniref:hypothetical protein n=1 Tax=Rhabdothermincola salaria TaxID=2903142 RepID=UPI001E5CDBF3|nr:hypothetical protein [Rhabdothermincola salaria]MCD9623241.1 hypothetical protein [Rhabdothermincola salaria]
MGPDASAAPTRGRPAAAAVDEFVDALAECVDRAAGATAEVETRALDLGGHGLAIRIAGRGLAAILDPALAHAHTAVERQPDLRIDCWDRAVTGVAPPSPPWALTDFLPTGAVRGHAEDRVRVSYDRWMRMLTVYDRDRGRAFLHVADADDVPVWVQRSPMRQLFGWWAADHGMALLHAGTVATDHGAVALAGASGSGKSTTTLTCMAAGMGFMGDDACLVDWNPAATATTLFGLAKLEPDAFERMASVRHLAVGGDPSQPLLDPSAHIVPHAPLRAVLLVSVADDGVTSLEDVSPSDALHTLVMGSLDEGGATTLTGLRRVATEFPCRRLRLGSDPAAIVDAVDAAARAGP